MEGFQGFTVTIAGDEAAARSFDSAIVIGRDASADMTIDDREVSKRHCEIQPVEEGWILTDLGSRNGTFVGGERIRRLLLRDGEVVRVGRTNLHFILHGPAVGAIRPDALVSAEDVEAGAIPLLNEAAPGRDDLFAAEPISRAIEDSNLPSTPKAADASEPPEPAEPAFVARSVTRLGGPSLWERASTPSGQITSASAIKPMPAARSDAASKASKLAAALRERFAPAVDDLDSAWHRRRLPAPLLIAAAAIALALGGWLTYSAVLSGPKRPATPAHTLHAHLDGD